jgi:cytochrome c553
MKSLVLATVLFVSLSAQAQDAAQGKAKFVSCTACHGAQGQGGAGPKLAGQSASAIEKKLTAYKNKQQVGPQSQLMWGMAGALSPADIKNIAAYIGTLK